MKEELHQASDAIRKILEELSAKYPKDWFSVTSEQTKTESMCGEINTFKVNLQSTTVSY